MGNPSDNPQDAALKMLQSDRSLITRLIQSVVHASQMNVQRNIPAFRAAYPD